MKGASVDNDDVVARRELDAAAEVFAAKRAIDDAIADLAARPLSDQAVADEMRVVLSAARLRKARATLLRLASRTPQAPRPRLSLVRPAAVCDMGGMA